MTRRGWVLFGALSVIWGVPYLLIKIAVADVDPVIVAFGRTFVAALLLLPIALYRRALMPVFRRWKWLLRLHRRRDQRTVVAARARRDHAEQLDRRAAARRRADDRRDHPGRPPGTTGSTLAASSDW